MMNIKHPCKPKPVCCCIPITILLQDGLQDLKCAVITLVYTTRGAVTVTRYYMIPGLESALRLGKDILGISQSYSFYLEKHGTGIYQVYTWDMKIMMVVIMIYT